MLDSRYETFLVLCDTMSYTKAAQFLYVTQPAVTQHIKYLEGVYHTRLFSYTGKRLALTGKGEELRRYVTQMKLNALQIEKRMLADRQRMTLRIGATKTIGEFVIPRILEAYLKQNADTDADLFVDNTQVLLSMLDAGEIDFALLEGFFDKSAYEYRLLKREPFIGVCSPDSPLRGRRRRLDELLGERIIVREQGSGTREIIERILQQYSLDLKSFVHESQISSFAAIKALVKKDAGITFLYRPAAEEELREQSLCELDIEDFPVKREFNFVMPKNSLMAAEFLKFFDFCLQM